MWSLDVQWTDVDCDELNGVLYATNGSQIGAVIDSTGKKRRQIPYSSTPGRSIRLMRQGNGNRVLITFDKDQGLVVFETNGRRLWSFAIPDSIVDVWPSDLDGDGSDEVVVRYKFVSDHRIKVLSSRGELIGSSDEDIASLCSGRILDDGKRQIIASCNGRLYFMGKNLTLGERLMTGHLANVVCISNKAVKNSPEMLLAAGPVQSSSKLCRFTSFTNNPQVKRSMWLRSQHPGEVASMCASTGTPWVAVGLDGGAVNVLDVTNHKTVASWYGLGDHPKVRWIRDKESPEPLLVVATGQELNAFRVIQFE